MEITVDAIKALREMTSCGVIECKSALEEAEGDMNKAKVILQKRGLELAAKKGSRDAKDDTGNKKAAENLETPPKKA